MIKRFLRHLAKITRNIEKSKDSKVVLAKGSLLLDTKEFTVEIKKKVKGKKK